MFIVIIKLFKDEESSDRGRIDAVEDYGDGEEEEEYSDEDDFIVDDDGKPIKKKAKRKPIYADT